MKEETKHIIIKIRPEDEARFTSFTKDIPDYRLFGQMLDTYEAATQQKNVANNPQLDKGVPVISSAEEKPPARVKKRQAYRALHGKAASGMMPGLQNRGKLGFPDF